MRSCGRCLAVLLLVLTSTAAAAQDNAERLFKEAVGHETTLRQEIETRKAGSPALPLLRRVRILVSTYDDIARLFPRSAYSDNALWQGGILAADAFREFGDPADRTTALRLLNALPSRYPSSSLVPQVTAQVTRLAAAPAVPAPPVAARVPAAPVAVTVPAPPVAVAPPQRPSPVAPVALLTAIRRDVLPGALRVTLELEHEVVFHEERLDGPPRVFIDLQNTKAVDALKDATLSYTDDIVRQIRIGRQLGTRVRVVLDLDKAGRHSAYALYNPFRIVVDVERPGGAIAAASMAAPPLVTPAGEAALVSGAPPVRRPAAPPLRAVDAPPPRPVAPQPNVGGGLSLSRQLGLGVTRIVIDPGHGGHDPGARVNGLTEAALVLDVALRLEKLLVKEGVEVVLTRRSDEYVPLEQRTAMANREEADLFLSIHVNASEDGRARGVETYFLNFAPNPGAEAIAARENAASAQTMRSLPDIIKAIATNNKIDESRDFASRLQAAMVERLRKAKRASRNLGVRQAPFMVLIGATMPSALAEISFITNRQEATWLKTQTYRQQLAEALFNGVMRYQRSLKGTQIATATR